MSDLELTAAVDASARAWWARTTRSGVGFDALNAHDQYTARAFVLPIVTAAAPVIAEQAWDEGHGDGVTDMEQDSMIEAGLRQRLTNPYRKAPDE